MAFLRRTMCLQEQVLRKALELYEVSTNPATLKTNSAESCLTDIQTSGLQHDETNSRQWKGDSRQCNNGFPPVQKQQWIPAGAQATMDSRRSTSNNEFPPVQQTTMDSRQCNNGFPPVKE